MLYSGWVPQDADAEHSAGMGTQGNDVVGILGDITFNGGPSLGPGRNGTNFTTGGVLVVAQEQDSAGGGFSASQAFVRPIAIIRIYNRVLSKAEVKQNYLASRARFSDTRFELGL